MRPNGQADATSPAASLADEIKQLARGIAALQAQLLASEQRAMRHAAYALREEFMALNATSVTRTPSHAGLVRVTHIVTSAPNGGLTLQLRGDANNASLSLGVPTGVQVVTFGGKDFGGLILSAGDVVKLSTTGAAATMTLLIYGERLPETYQY